MGVITDRVKSVPLPVALFPAQSEFRNDTHLGTVLDRPLALIGTGLVAPFWCQQLTLKPPVHGGSGSSWTVFRDRTMMCSNPEFGAVIDADLQAEGNASDEVSSPCIGRKDEA